MTVRAVDAGVETYLPGQLADVSGRYPVDAYLVNVNDLTGPVEQLHPSGPVDAVILSTFEGSEVEFLERADAWGVRSYLTNNLPDTLSKAR